MNTLEGPLCKWTNVVKGWQYRWFTLDHNQGLLSYYTSREKMIKGDRRGCVRLKGAVIGIAVEDDSTFTITVDGKMFHFQAHDAEDRIKWIKALEETILHYAHKRKSRKSDFFHLPTLNEFEKKLSETDSYLQLLINKTKILDKKISNVTNEKDEKKLVDIKAQLLTLLDGVKHTIVLLQIAKNTVNPINGTINETNVNQLSKKNLNQEIGETSNVHQISELVTSKINDQFEKYSINEINLNNIPEMSYSSSEDDDFFYDAEEEATSISINPNIDAACKNIKNLNMNNLKSLNMHSTKLNYDSIYEEDDEEDLGNIESHGSVISHLISQVKIGMDLTKVVLPTFILEKRSLLEMYADFFAHPDLFISIPDYETPEERFIQTIRWYLSAFHAGRKHSVAKKPYNPVLGEIFRCFWTNPSKNETPSETISNGPVPWATGNDLTFIAEQVSHHPPVSAFYAEHVDKKIMCSAHIYTKSKFLGLSIGVHNIGQGSIYLLDKGEEYIVTFPSAYGRSILTVPWVELGGIVNVKCPQTGYHAVIEFLTKPFYGKKKHMIKGEIFNPNKNTILTLSGEWNGIVLAKWMNGKNEVFVDTKSMKTLKKKVKPIAEQEIYESRRLWKDVTAALKLQDVISATNAKFAIEQAQRELVKQRVKDGLKWVNRVFYNLGDNWYYKNLLTQRLSKAK